MHVETPNNFCPENLRARAKTYFTQILNLSSSNALPNSSNPPNQLQPQAQAPCPQRPRGDERQAPGRSDQALPVPAASPRSKRSS